MGHEPLTLTNGCRDGASLCHLEVAADADVTLQFDGVPCEKKGAVYQCGAMSLYTEAPKKFFYLPGPRQGSLTLFRRGINVSNQRVALPHRDASELVAWREKVLKRSPSASEGVSHKPAHGEPVEPSLRDPAHAARAMQLAKGASPKVQFEIAAAFAEVGDVDRALQVFDQARKIIEADDRKHSSHFIDNSALTILVLKGHFQRVRALVQKMVHPDWVFEAILFSLVRAQHLSEALAIVDQEDDLEGGGEGLVDALITVGRLDDALRVVKRIKSRTISTKIEILSRIVLALKVAGKQQEAVKAARWARDLADDDPDALCDATRVLLAVGLRDEATAVSKDVLKKVEDTSYLPWKGQVLGKLVQILAEIPEPVMARAVIKQAAQLAEHELPARYGNQVFGSIAAAAIRLGEVDRGLKFFGSISDLYAKSAAARDVVPALLDNNQIDVAVQVVEQLPGWPVDKFRALRMLIVGLIRAGQHDRAMALLARSRAKDAWEFVDEHISGPGYLGLFPGGIPEIAMAFATAGQFDRAVWVAEQFDTPVRPIAEQIPTVAAPPTDGEQQKTPPLPVALLLYNTSDWNGGFEGDRVADPLVQSGQFRVFYREVKNERELHAAIAAVHVEAGAPIHTLMIAGHGDRTSLLLGKGVGERVEIDTGDFRQGDFSHFASHLDPVGQLLLNACSNGKGGVRAANLTNAFARILPPTFAIFSTTVDDSLSCVSVGPDHRLIVEWQDGPAYNTSGRLGVDGGGGTR